MKALVIGCNGLLGQNLLRTLPKGWEAAGAGLEEAPHLGGKLSEYVAVDITRRASLQDAVRRCAPDWIFNAAALTDVDKCEREPDLCDLINRDAVGSMAGCGAPMVHVSSDYVFDGDGGPYREEDPVRPINHYGRSKLESEALVTSASPRSLVLRTMTLWGRGRGAKTSFVDFIRASLEAGKPVRIVTDQWGNPTLAEDLALAAWKLVLGGKAGIYHVAGSEWNSRFQWANAIAGFYGLDRSLIQPCLTADLKQAARRPLQSGLHSDKLDAAVGFRPGNVETQLRRVQEASYLED